jgi:hypothetical protein
VTNSDQQLDANVVRASTFSEFAEFVRDFACLRRDKRITEETGFEHDLGITGDDGDDLLEEVQEHFGIELTPETFNLRPKKALFHDEASILLLDQRAKDELLRLDPSRAEREYRPFTVGEFYGAVLHELLKKP